MGLDLRLTKTDDDTAMSKVFIEILTDLKPARMAAEVRRGQESSMSLFKLSLRILRLGKPELIRHSVLYKA